MKPAEEENLLYVSSAIRKNARQQNRLYDDAVKSTDPTQHGPHSASYRPDHEEDGAEPDKAPR